MIKLLMKWWGLFLFRDRGILPTKRLFYSFLLLSSILLIASVFINSWTIIVVINILFIAVSLADLAYSPKKNEIDVGRIVVGKMERGITYTVTISIRNNSLKSMVYRLKDGIPQSFHRSYPVYGSIKGQSAVKVNYTVAAPIRGNYSINNLYFRFASKFGLWEKQITFPLENRIQVIPDLTETKKYLESAQQFLLHEGSKIRKQRQGAGEFSKIRSFVVGDDPRKINWRQTAKLQEVMTNEYEPEHGKYITLLIDCGRMMGAELSKANRLEKSLESAITVAAAALQNGDYVSVVCFGKEVNVYVPAAKGMAHLKTIVNAVYNVQVEANESNYAAVLHYLQTVQKKRSFILLFSDIHTFLHEESGLTYLNRLRQRHLFYIIGIEDEAIQQMVSDDSEAIDRIMVKSMAQYELLYKKQEKLKWEKQGLHMVEAREEKLAVAAVSHYIDAMNRGLV